MKVYVGTWGDYDGDYIVGVWSDLQRALSACGGEWTLCEGRSDIWHRRGGSDCEHGNGEGYSCARCAVVICEYEVQ